MSCSFCQALIFLCRYCIHAVSFAILRGASCPPFWSQLSPLRSTRGVCVTSLRPPYCFLDSPSKPFKCIFHLLQRCRCPGSERGRTLAQKHNSLRLCGKAQTFQVSLELAACSMHEAELHLTLTFHCKLVVAFLCLKRAANLV
jgi:hypothetical protein